MTFTDWVIDIVLVLIVFKQLREERMSIRTVLLPAGIIAYVANLYLHNIPTAGNDLLLVGVFVAIGLTFGLFGGLLTRVRAAGGNVYIKATWSAATLWVTSMSLRGALAYWATTHTGQLDLGRFSVAHHITSSEAWVAALILMALSEVIVRIGIVVVRGQRLASRNGDRVLMTPARRTVRQDDLVA
ncbi:MAG TPA: hypothetical protein VKV06_12685 [Acidimicrobiales bacterium]|nr:hypothetical protein [Acidimicrobiales bacterium]